MTPVPLRIQVSHVEFIRKPESQLCHGTGDLSRDESFPTQWTLMVEQYAITGINIISLTVVHGNPVGIKFGNCIWRPGVERSCFRLGYLLHLAIQFGCGSLVDPCLFFQLKQANCFQYTKGTNSICVGSVFRRIKTHLNMAHSAKVVY